MEPKITVLAWIPMELMRPPTTTCLFTDGLSFWAGWYSNTDQCIYPNTGDSSKGFSLNRVTHWAKLNNLVKILEAA